MPVFRTATSDPAVQRPAVDPPHPAGAAPQRRPLPPGQWAPPRAPDPAFPEGPTEPLGATPDLPDAAATEPDAGSRRPRPPRPPRRSGIVLAVLLSVLALLISLTAGLFSWQTFETVRASRAAVVLPAAPAAPEPARQTARPPEPDRYPVDYAKEPLRLQLACAAVVHLDLDEPRAEAAESLADLRYESRCGSTPPNLSLGAGAAGGSRHVTGDTDAAGCDRAIRTSPLGRGLQIEARKGMALCVLTAAQPAELVLVEIIDVGGSGTAGLRATSWQVPA